MGPFPHRLLRRTTGSAVVIAMAITTVAVTATPSAAATTPSSPTVSSTDYPADSTGQVSGGSGVPGSFTFDAHGDTSVVGFLYGRNTLTDYVPADQPGGTATIQWAPPYTGYEIIQVESVDAAGNTSDEIQYYFDVADNRPSVNCSPLNTQIGVPQQCTFTPAPGSHPTGYHYTLTGYAASDLPPSTVDKIVPAGRDGSATVSVVPLTASPNLQVRSRLITATETDATSHHLQADDLKPIVTPAKIEVPIGTKVQFTFTTRLPDTESFTYVADAQGDFAQPPVTVPVGQDGTATVTIPIVPSSASSGYLVEVYSDAPVGVFRSGTAYADVTVDR